MCELACRPSLTGIASTITDSKCSAGLQFPDFCAHKALELSNSLNRENQIIDTLEHSRIPPSLTITRYLHDYSGARAITLVGPMYQGKSNFDTPLIFVDGGTAFRNQDQGLSVGDGDSYSGGLDEQLNPDKDYSDLAYVLSSLPAHFHKIELLGFLGGRRDHELANLGEIHHFLKHRHSPTRVLLDQAVAGFSAGDWQLEIHEVFSLMCVESTKLTLEGECEYPLNTLTQIEPLCSHGLSNIGRGCITLKTEQPVFVFYSGTGKTS